MTVGNSTGCITDATMSIYRLIKRATGIELNDDELGEIVRILRLVSDIAHHQGMVAERRRTEKL